MLDAIQRWLKSWHGNAQDTNDRRVQLKEPTWPSVVYAVGDVHGCLAELRALESRIVADAEAFQGEKWLVFLGDYIDRGPDSAGVLDQLLSPPPAGFRRICLAGNHEAMALEFFRAPRPDAEWLKFGGLETLQSYGIAPLAMRSASASFLRAVIDSHIPAEHLVFLKQLPLTLQLPGTVFVHAGIRVGIPMDRQREMDLLWIREDFFSAPPDPDLLVVHGHTPSQEPVVTPNRICVDTGAFATGILTAVRLSENGDIRLLNTAR